ncbi:MAG: glycosyltransferase [Gemmatimonadaceae bacterium]|nr:glycosyltransferase [Gloeobacterales cyanobacterium ES-bin-141]
MQILFLHRVFPGQFRYLAAALAANPDHQVVFGTMRPEGELPGVHEVLYAPARAVHPQTHFCVRTLENGVLDGQAVYRLAEQLKRQGFVPDIVYGHSGWGPTLFIKDIFPRARLLCYFEWFYRAQGSSHGFDPAIPVDANAQIEIRTKNAPILLDLHSCDAGISPTRWQQSQFPAEMRAEINVLHDGIPTHIVLPGLGRLCLPQLGLDLSAVEELVTYVATGMEPLRGFPQFIEAAALVLERRPGCHVVVVGEDRVEYGNTLAEGKTYKQLMLEKFTPDPSRLHFTGRLPYAQYVQVLQSSSVHVHLTYPYILSWSLMEALSAGCLVVGSATPPVMEMIRDGVNGLLVDFFSPRQIAERVEEVLDHPTRMAEIRARAWALILEKYALFPALFSALFSAPFSIL